MTYSVLVTTTRQLLTIFYRELVRGVSVGEALDLVIDLPAIVTFQAV